MSMDDGETDVSASGAGRGAGVKAFLAEDREAGARVLLAEGREDGVKALLAEGREAGKRYGKGSSQIVWGKKEEKED